MVSVNPGVNPGVNSGVNKGIQNKKSYAGAKIGAAAGIAAGAVRTYFVRDALKTASELALSSGYSKTLARTSMFAGVAFAVGIMAGVGALIGAGIQKAVNHLKKDKVAPEQKVVASNFADPRAVKLDNGEEYVIRRGKGREIYKKNPKTGKLEFKMSVYDGSWGPEMPDKDLVAFYKRTEEMMKAKAEN